MISTVVMFRAQNGETIKIVLEKLLYSSRLLPYDNERKRPCFTTHHQTCKTKTKAKTKTDFFLVSDRSCPKTDGLRPHHYQTEALGSHKLPPRQLIPQKNSYNCPYPSMVKKIPFKNSLVGIVIRVRHQNLRFIASETSHPWNTLHKNSSKTSRIIRAKFI